MEPATRASLIGLALYLLAALAILFVRLMPVYPGALGWPGPDLLLALTMAWVLRRPDQLPAPVIALAFLVEDLLTMRPPGLWATIALIGTEAARTREARWREQGFLLEWLRVSILTGGMMVADHIIKLLFMLEVPPLGMVLMQMTATAAAYPVVVLAARSILRLRHMSAAEAERLGYR